jgi:hypothetical protein
VEIAVEVTLKKSIFLASGEKRVLSDTNWELLLVVFRSNKNRNFKLLVNLSRVHSINGILSLPVLEEGLFDGGVKLLLQFVILLISILGSLVFWNEIEALNGGFSLVKSHNKTVGPDGKTCILGVREWHWWRALWISLKGILDFLNLSKEHLENHIRSFLVHVVNNERSLCERVEVL